MNNTLPFRRDKESIEDKNPFNEIFVTEVLDEGFKGENYPRVGIIKEKISKQEEKQRLQILSSLAKGYISK